MKSIYERIDNNPRLWLIYGIGLILAGAYLLATPELGIAPVLVWMDVK